MALENSDDMKRKDELKTQFTFLCDGVDEKVVVAAMRDYLEEHGWVLVSEGRFKKLNRVSSDYRTLCERMGSTMPAMIAELRGFQGELGKRLRALDSLAAIATEPIVNAKPED
jgi:hypothetical protein